MEHFLPWGGSEDCNLKNQRFAVLYVLLFFSNAWFEKVSNLGILNLSITEDGNLCLVFRKEKKNQFRNVKTLLVASSDHSCAL